MAKRRKKRIRYDKIFIAMILFFGIIFGGYKLFKIINPRLVSVDYYLASDTNTVDVYDYSKENGLSKATSLTRGTKVSSYNKKVTVTDNDYINVTIGENNYYVDLDNLSLDSKNVVLEKNKYVRTSVTVYENEIDSKITSFVKKGNAVEVLDYDKIDDDGVVNMYKIKYGDISGWVYQKYLVDTEEVAKENYNENGIYDKHKNRKYSTELYGGKASTLDYYPYEKPSFSDNPILETAKAMYLNAGADTLSDIDEYLNIATSSGVNAIVVDIKDGALAYPSEVAKEYSKRAYNSAINKLDKYKKVIDKIKAANIYVIGRIVVFNDTHFGKDNPDECIKSSYANWPSGFSRLAWEYNVSLAREAVSLFGFNEIQFDYVRFPEAAYEMSKNKNTDFKNKYKEEKAEAIQNFLFYAADQLHKDNVYLSVDVFGECSGTYVTSYGQYWPAISNIVDAISSMPYTDHFGREVDTWSNPYTTVYNWAKGAAARQKEIATPAIPRTWITAYNTPYWNPTVVYDASKISDQATALSKAGLKGGFITWNSASNINKYKQIKSAFKKDY